MSLLTDRKPDRRAELAKKLTKSRDMEWKLCAMDFFHYARYIKTYDEENESIRAFPVEYEYLHDVHNRVEEHNKGVIHKSRRLMMSWYFCARQQWRAKFAGTGAIPDKEVFSGAFISVSEKEVKNLMDRPRFIEENLPDWMKERNPLTKNNELDLIWKCRGRIEGFKHKKEGTRTFGFTEMFLDEMAFQEHARGVWTGAAPTLGAKGKMWAVSTANGRGNLFYQIWSNRNNRYPDVHRIDLCKYDLHPEHDENWLKELSRSMDEQMIAREIYGSFAAQVGDPVWPEYKPQVHRLDETEVMEDRAMFVGWDLGFHTPAVTFWQKNNRDQWIGHREIVGEDCSFEVFCDQVIEFAETFYNRRKIKEIHCVPPDARMRYRQVGKSGSVCDADTISKKFKVSYNRVQLRFGEMHTGTRYNESPRLKIMRPLWRLRADGQPGILFNKQMENFHEGCLSGYCWQEKRGGSGEYTEEPTKNEFSHVQDSAQCVVTAEARIHNLGQTKKKETKRRVLPRGRFRIPLPNR